MQKEVSEIIDEVKRFRRLAIVEDMTNATNRLTKCTDELDSILQASREWDWDIPEKFSYEVGTYANSVTIQEAQNKEAYNNMLLCLVDRYGDGKRSADGDDSIQYTWVTSNDWWNNVRIYLKVKSSISGCVIVKKREFVPREVIPETIKKAHWTEKNVLECVDNGV